MGMEEEEGICLAVGAGDRGTQKGELEGKVGGAGSRKG